MDRSLGKSETPNIKKEIESSSMEWRQASVTGSLLQILCSTVMNKNKYPWTGKGAGGL